MSYKGQDKYSSFRGWASNILKLRARPSISFGERGTDNIVTEAKLLGAELGAAGMICPNDGNRLELHSVIENDGENQISNSAVAKSERVLSCNECGYMHPVAPIIQKARAQLVILKSAERQFFVYGIGIAIVFGVISYFNGNLITFLGGLILGLILMIRGIFFRYRHWQVSEGRMYEGRPPIIDWLRAEWRN